MNLMVILILLLLAVVLGVVLFWKLQPGKVKIGALLCVIGFFPLLFGVYLIPATMWRTISVICILIAVILFAVGGVNIMKARQQ